MTGEAELVGGPQDGAKVKAVGGRLPPVIHVGPKWQGDGFAAWTSTGPGKRLMVRYEKDKDGRYHHKPTVG